MYFKYFQVKKNEENKYKTLHNCKLQKIKNVFRVNIIFKTKL